MEMYAQRKGWDVGDVEVACDYTPAERGCPTRFNLVLRFPDTSTTSRSSACGSSPRSARCTARSTARSCSTSVSSASRSRAELAAGAPARRSCSTPARPPALDVHGRTDAAVLVPLFSTATAAARVFTRRRDDLRRHAGEISFPGGRQDDDERPARRPRCARPTRRSACARTTSSWSARCSRRRRSPPTTRSIPFVGLIEPGREWTLSPERGRRGPRAVARRPARPATSAGACCAAACRSAPTPTWSATT